MFQSLSIHEAREIDRGKNRHTNLKHHPDNIIRLASAPEVRLMLKNFKPIYSADNIISIKNNSS